MEGHRKIALDLLVVEVCLHGSVERFLVADDSAELQMVGDLVTLLDCFDLRQQAPLLHVVLWSFLDASSRFYVAPPVLVVGLTENETILIAFLVLHLCLKVILRCLFRFGLCVFCIC